MDPRAMGKALRLFSVLDATHLPAHFIQVFLVIGERGWCRYEEIEEELGLSNSAVSRTVMALGKVNRKGEAGFDLVRLERDPTEGRRYLVSLNSKGKALWRTLLDVEASC